MLCKECGCPINPDDLFCGNCGAKIEKEQTVEESTEKEAVSCEKPLQQEEPEAKKLSANKEEGFDPYSYKQGVESSVEDKSEAAEASKEEKQKETQEKKQEAPTEKSQIKKSGKKSIKINKKALIAIGIAIIVIIAAAVGVNAAKTKFAPIKTAEEFANDLFSKNWNNVYNLINIEESEFVNKDTFIAMCENNPNCFGVDLNTATYYDVYCTSGGEPGMERSLFTMSCVTEYGDEDIEFVVVKDKDRFWFFDTYKVEITYSPIVSYRIYAPSDSSVKVNGIEIAYVEETEEDYGYYGIDKILPGKYTLEVSRENCESYSADVTVYNRFEAESGEAYWGDEEDYEMVNGGGTDNRYYVSLYYTDEYVKSVEDTAISLMTSMLKKAAACNSDVSDIPFTDEAAKQYAVEELNESIEDIDVNTDDSYYTYGDISIDSLTIDREYDDIIYCSWNNDYTYYYDFILNYSYSWNYNGSYYEDSGVRDRTAYPDITIVNVDGEWKIDDISFYMYV